MTTNCGAHQATESLARPLTGYGSVPVTHRTFAGHCLAPKKQPAGYAGPRVVFNKCVHTVDKTEKVPTPWGVNLGSAPLFLRFAATGGGPHIVTASLSVRNEKRDQLIKDRKNHNQFTCAPMCRREKRNVFPFILRHGCLQISYEAVQGLAEPRRDGRVVVITHVESSSPTPAAGAALATYRASMHIVLMLMPCRRCH